ncbi:type II secretion system protein GspE [Pectobacteriaceae bacterium CE70]|uniref:Type II secretion system protein GspE n=1 Tax=Serratia sp. (strain ATCC 39006) TaxID=104623 RepID=A0A2I5TGS7_SERS3|nr:type II secretion system protein GspE [Serratia sp. ATCC 39006]AUG99450.1 type II secretion system protein GspE [Serratia sp. ATCC 39006]AUH03768.1 type II secretion system protein GspE [Serratia sp. ATCC 39006]WJV66232.1 type II secretion system protein GspE [Pectobacteriaceae bacterium CE70]WJY10241.1 type II secretion system protein GspE [Pectobacteriaceae bacterium C80]
MMNNDLSKELSSLCHRYHALLLDMDDQTLSIAINGTESKELISALRFASNRHVLIEQWPVARLEQHLNPYQETENVQQHQAAPNTIDDGEDAPVVQFINQTLKLAIQRRASDIHFEPLTSGYRVRLRIDGVLQEVPSVAAELSPRITARLKIMGKLNIAERRLPQDGQFSLSLDQQSYSFRIATLPVQEGEKVVLRVLQTHQHALTLETLGLSPVALQQFMKTLQLPQGMILVTGPTGSGKTFTLYSAIRWLNDTSRNICSVEDPVEIPLTGINQTAINTKNNLSFGRVLRALLRQDPDVIMVGEIRDAETAEIAVNAAQTGHLVLSTLHTNSAAETLTRLRQLGVPGYLLAAALRLIISQRLVRRLCPYCRTATTPELSLPPHLWQGSLHRWTAQGCNHCFSGYYGRAAIYELLVITPDMQQALAEDIPVQQAAHASSTVFPSLLSAGLSLVNEGVTSQEEVYRVIGDITN